MEINFLVEMEARKGIDGLTDEMGKEESVVREDVEGGRTTIDDNGGKSGDILD